MKRLAVWWKVTAAHHFWPVPGHMCLRRRHQQEEQLLKGCGQRMIMSIVGL
jgi:hypothetical protein